MYNSVMMQHYMVMIGATMNSPKLKTLRIIDGACWITENAFVWMHESREKLTITIKPSFSMQELLQHSSIDIKHDSIDIRDSYNPKGINIPRISTEEEYFQQSTIHDLSNFNLDFFKQCAVLFDKTWDQLTWCK